MSGEAPRSPLQDASPRELVVGFLTVLWHVLRAALFLVGLAFAIALVFLLVTDRARVVSIGGHNALIIPF